MKTNNVNNSKTERVLVLGKYPNSGIMFITNLEYSVFNKVFMSKLAEIKDYRKYNTTNYLNTEEVEAEIQTINQLTSVDTNYVYEVVLA